MAAHLCLMEKMSDMNRPVFSLKPTIPRVGPRVGHLDLKIFYDGIMHPSPHAFYQGGSVSHAHSINTFQFSLNQLVNIVSTLSVKPICKIHYRIPEKSLDEGLRLLWSESFASLLSLAATHESYIELFVEHGEVEDNVKLNVKGNLEVNNEPNLNDNHKPKQTHPINMKDIYNEIDSIDNMFGEDLQSNMLGEDLQSNMLGEDEQSNMLGDEQNSDDEVASLGHISEDENEEWLLYRQQNLALKLKKEELKRQKQEKRIAKEIITKKYIENEVEMETLLSDGEDFNEVEVEPELGAAETNEVQEEEEEDSGDELNEEEQEDFLNELKSCSSTVNLEDYMSEYEDSDLEFGDPFYDSDDVDHVVQEANNLIKWPVFDPKLKWKLQEPAKGMLFKSIPELKHCIINYAVAHGREIWFQKSQKGMLIARCKKGCGWRCYASKQQMVDTMQVKSYNPHHFRRICVKNFKVKLVNSRWLAKDYATKIRQNPKWDLFEFRELVKYRHGISVTLTQCYKARQIGLAEVESVLIQHYAKLWGYKEELERSNPGSTFVLLGKDSEDGENKIFDKFYCCFAALKRGWAAGCRPVIGLDGCFLKSFISGQLLCAVGRDGNNHMFPIAWAVVEVESTETWTWFMSLLKQDIGSLDGFGLTFISDEQKGLLNGLQHIYPEAEARNCARHIYANFRKHFHGEALKNKFWNASKSGTEAEFLNEMDGIKKLSVKAFNYLMAHKPQNWCRGYFSTLSCCDNVENNLSETFNAFILAARKKPIIRMLEDIRQALMVRLVEKKEFFLKTEDRLCPKARKKLETAKSNFKHWEARNNGNGGYEIRKGLEGYVVDLGERTCTCRMWQMSGVPCSHAVCAIAYTNDDCDKFVNPMLTVDHTLKAYDFPMMPVNGEKLWPRSGEEPLLPPLKRRGLGRPKKDRYKEWGEKGNTTRKRKPKVVANPVNPFEITRAGRKMRCTNCNLYDHNARKCKNPRVEGDPILDKRRKRQRRKKNVNDTEGEVVEDATDGPDIMETEQISQDQAIDAPGVEPSSQEQTQPTMEAPSNSSRNVVRKPKLPVFRKAPTNTGKPHRINPKIRSLSSLMDTPTSSSVRQPSHEQTPPASQPESQPLPKPGKISSKQEAVKAKTAKEPAKNIGKSLDVKGKGKTEPAVKLESIKSSYKCNSNRWNAGSAEYQRKNKGKVEEIGSDSDPDPK